MGNGDIRDEWRLKDIERKVDNADRRLYELDSLKSNVDRLQCENRELSSSVDELRAKIEACVSKEQLESLFEHVLFAIEHNDIEELRYNVCRLQNS